MELPFSHEAFIAVFARYNEAIWPAQVPGYALGIGVLVAAVLRLAGRRMPATGRASHLVLALMWLWTGIAYHGLFFRQINPAAIGFAALFAVAGTLFLWSAAVRRPPALAARIGFSAGLGIAFLAYALFGYPAIGALAGQAWPAVPVFGVAPCPVVLFTWGVLLLGEERPWLPLLAVPALWSLVGGSAAFLLAVPQDWVLLASLVLALPVLLAMPRPVAGAGTIPGR